MAVNRVVSSHVDRVGLTRANVPASVVMRQSGMALSIFQSSGSKIPAIYTRQAGPRLGMLS